MVERQRDSQRQKVYDWERTLPGRFPNFDLGAVLTTAEITALVAKVCKRYGQSAPAIRWRNSQFQSASFQTTWQGDFLTFPTWARQTFVVLHEVAHAVTMRQGPHGIREAGHGPIFVRVYLDLLAWHSGVPLRDLRATATAARLKVAKTADTPQPLGRDEARLVARLKEARKAVRVAQEAAQAAVDALNAYRAGQGMAASPVRRVASQR